MTGPYVWRFRSGKVTQDVAESLATLMYSEWESTAYI